MFVYIPGPIPPGRFGPGGTDSPDGSISPVQRHREEVSKARDTFYMQYMDIFLYVVPGYMYKYLLFLAKVLLSIFFTTNICPNLQWNKAFFRSHFQ